MPEIRTIWEAIQDTSDEEAFIAICNNMRDEVARIAFPLGGDELKGKLNEIQNRSYLRLERQFSQLAQFKKYHREFMQLAQKLTRESKRSNAQVLKDKTMKELRDFVRVNLSLQSVEPTNLSLIKVLIERMDLRARGEP